LYSKKLLEVLKEIKQDYIGEDMQKEGDIIDTGAKIIFISNCIEVLKDLNQKVDDNRRKK